MQNNDKEQIKFGRTPEEIEQVMEKVKESLFVSKSYPDPEWYFNASLHIKPGDWHVYAEGYKTAADIAVQYIADNDWYQNYLVYPIAFLYRHYLELRLKELIILTSQYLDKYVEMPTGHKLMPLWEQVRPNIEEIWDDPETRGHLEAIEAKIQELYEVDRRSDAFRYPVDMKGDTTLEELRHINLKHLKDVMQGISQFLDGASIGVDMYLDAKHDMLSDFRAVAEYDYY